MGDKVLTYGGGGGGSTSGTTSSSSQSGQSGAGSGSGGSSGGGGGGGYDYAAEARKAKRRAANRAMQNAATLGVQAKAIQKMLDRGFEKRLRTKLRNLNNTLADQDTIFMEGFRERRDDIKKTAEENDKSAADQQYAALSNAARERINAVTEATTMGAGETDMLRAQGAALRNWDANASEVARARVDTLKSINSGVVDLNSDSKTARFNLFNDALADKEQLWTDYYGQRSEAYTQLGNVRGQQAQEYATAQEYGAGKKAKRRMRQTRRAAERAFMEAAEAASEAWKSPGVPGKVQNWRGMREIEDTQAQQAGAVTSTLTTLGDTRQAPEGATLRRWTV